MRVSVFRDAVKTVDMDMFKMRQCSQMTGLLAGQRSLILTQLAARTMRVLLTSSDAAEDAVRANAVPLLVDLLHVRCFI